MLSGRNFTRRALFFCLGLLLLVPALPLPEGERWSGLRMALALGAALGLLLLVLIQARPDRSSLRAFLLSGPNLAVLLLVGWAFLSFLFAAPAAGRERALAQTELLRLAGGAALFFGIAPLCDSRGRLEKGVLLLLAGGLLVALAGIWSSFASPLKVAAAGFGNPQLLAAWLLLLLPLAVVFAFTARAEERRLLAAATGFAIVVCLLLTQNRGAWLGAAVGLVTAGCLGARLAASRRAGDGASFVNLARRWLPLAAAGLLGLALIAALPAQREAANERAGSLAAARQDASFRWRLQVWSIGAAMLRARPLAGIGIGNYPVQADGYADRARVTPVRDGRGPALRLLVDGRPVVGVVPPAAQVRAEGASMSSLAHSEYVQLAAELGLVGLALYQAVLFGFFRTGVRALDRVGSCLRGWLLVALLGAVAGQCVDALASAAWRFPEVSLLLWLCLGLGPAIARTAAPPPCAPAPLRPCASAPLPPCLASERRWRRAWQLACIAGALAVAGPLSAGGGPSPLYLRVQPATLFFPSTRVETTSTRQVRIENLTAIAVTVDLSVSGGPGTPFSPQPSSFTLAGGETREVPVNFTPVRLDIFQYTAALEVRADGHFEGQVELVGSVPEPQLVVFPTGQLEFGPDPSTFDRNLTIRNLGQAGSILVGSVTLSPGVAFSVPAGGSFRLERNETALILIRFTPTGPGDVTESALVSANGSGGSATVQLVGHGGTGFRARANRRQQRRRR